MEGLSGVAEGAVQHSYFRFVFNQWGRHSFQLSVVMFDLCIVREKLMAPSNVLAAVL